MRVGIAMREPFTILSSKLSVRDALVKTQNGGLAMWPVTDDQEFCGMIGREELENAGAQGGADQTLRALLQVRSLPQRAHAPALPYLHPDQSLALALERMGILGCEILPVVSRADARQLLGIVTLQGILAAYGVSPASQKSLA